MTKSGYLLNILAYAQVLGLNSYLSMWVPLLSHHALKTQLHLTYLLTYSVDPHGTYLTLSHSLQMSGAILELSQTLV